MNKLFQTIGIAIIILLSLGIYLNTLTEQQFPLGSIQDGQAYNSTTTYTPTGVAMPTGFNQLKSLAGTLGSINVEGANTGRFILWNATSTTDVSSTTILTIPASIATGTYVYDLTFPRGLILETIGTVPTSTITWR